MTPTDASTNLAAKAKAKVRRHSEALTAAVEKRAGFKPVTVDGIGPGELITVKPAMFGKLDVDPAYQRGETNMINQIVRAVQLGGMIPDPVTLCKRKNSDKLWIVDGHQRVCAFQELGRPFQAMLHSSEGVDAEKTLFIALNSKRQVSANVIVKAWAGPGGELLRKANASPEHPLYERINFLQSSNDARLAASSLARGLLALVGSDNVAGRVDMFMSRIDIAISASPRRRQMAEVYLRMIGRICPKGNLPHLVLRAIGIVGAERWADQPVAPPSAKVIERLAKKNWASDVVLVKKYMPVLVESIRKIWKEAP